MSDDFLTVWVGEPLLTEGPFLPCLTGRDFPLTLAKNLMKIEIRVLDQEGKNGYREEHSLQGSPWCFSNAQAMAQTKAQNQLAALSHE